MDSSVMPRKLWEHPNPEGSAMYKLMETINQRERLTLKTFAELHAFSITHSGDFWEHVLHAYTIIYEGSYDTVVDHNARVDSVPSWFDGAYTNFAENILYTRSLSEPSQRSTEGREDSKVAITEIQEDNTEARHITWAQLRLEVAELTSAMKQRGMVRGDRIAVVGANSFDTLKVVLATTALGGLFSSSSTDMGSKGILERLLQIEPKWLFMDDSALYGHQKIDLRPKMTAVVQGLQSSGSFEGLISMARFSNAVDITGVPRSRLMSEFVSSGIIVSKEIHFERVAFRDPALIVYSSGTTGQPKCIVHSVGGLLLSSVKEVILHREIDPSSVVLQYTTTGWIMYFSMVSNLLAGARLILYDGRPFPVTSFLQVVAREKVTILGTSPKWLQEVRRNGISPREHFDLSSLRKIATTGMVLAESLFEWFYDVAFPAHVHLANLSGGTDIAGSFACENPLTPLYVGGTQGPSLGIAVEVYDSNREGTRLEKAPVADGSPGELVATNAFPNMPIGFWGDRAGYKYFQSYFERYDNVWTHGDFVMIHPVTKGITFLGRSDGVLNPSGIRFGTAELYSIIEQNFPQIEDSIAVGQRRPKDVDEKVLLFVKMKPDHRFSRSLVQDIKVAIRAGLSARHVPSYIFETPEIPMTSNMKKVEMPIKQIVSGKIISPSATLANPKSLDYYYQFAEVERLNQHAKL